LKEGLLVPLALPGAVLQDDTKIGTATFGGRTSQGMMLSEKELGLETESPTLMFLDEDEVKIGDNIVEALKLKDYVIDIELTANRPDCLSIFGIAREIAAYYKIPLKIKKPDLDPHLTDAEPIIELSVIEEELCPYYYGREIKDIKISPSPVWIKSRLTALGLRPINNIVDITNYILLETGQPLHAFDSKLLKQGKVVVRLAKNKEKITLLDGQELELSDKDLVIADGERPVALAGVMGGEGTHVEDTTTQLFLECANFYPHIIRRTSKRYGISTDSSYRFERGIDPENILNPPDRASELIAKLSGGKILQKIVVADNLSHEPRKIFLSTGEVSRLLGTEIEKNSIVEILTNLHFIVNDNDEDLIVNPPAFRLDVEREVDLVEEIARFQGYDHFPPQLPTKSLTAGRIDQRRYFENRIKNLLISCGLYEIIAISLINENLLRKALLHDTKPYENFVKLLNPLNKEQSIMRTTLLVNLLHCLKHNINHHKKDVAFFELSPVYFKDEKNSYIEPLRLSRCDNRRG
jgi:phenylalanyl-tRNA synthetase beta chain